MPGERVILQNFSSQFEGVNKGESHLTLSENQALTCQNGRLTRQRSLTKRLGGKFIAGDALQTYGAPTRGLHNYTYSDSTTSLVTEQLIGSTADIYRLIENSFTITRTGGSSTCYWTYLLHASTQTCRFVINQGGSDITLSGNPYFATGSYTEDSTTTIYDLCAAIDAHANFSCTFPDAGARVDGLQSNVTTVTVDAGHTVVPGDYIYLPNNGGTGPFRRVTATAATTITFSGTGLTFGDNQNIGSWAMKAASIDFSDDTTQVNLFSSSVAITCFHWVIVPDGSSTGSPTTGASFSGYQGTTFTNLNDIAYFPKPDYTSGGFVYTAKYDGNRYYAAGLPAEPRVTQVAVGGAGNVDAGLHYWMLVLRFRDNRGNIIESNPSVEVSATAAPSTTTVTITTLLDGGSNWCLAYATVNGNQAGVNTITVDTGHSLLPGDYACLLDGVSGAIVHRLITAVTATTIVISGTAVNVSDNETISSGATGLIYRTKVGGYEFFLVNENPLPGNVTTIGVVDNIADTNLGEQYFPPDEPRDPPPNSRIVANHQGLLVLADGDGIYWSNPESPEYFPAYNQTSIPPTQKGDITAMASDTDNMFAVFKAEAYYNIVGDLASSSYNIITVTEGDVGCPGRDAITRCEGELLFVSQRGIMALRGGTLSFRYVDVWASDFKNVDFTIPITQDGGLLNRSTLRLALAQAVNYPHQNVCVFMVPAISGISGASGSYRPNIRSKLYAFDYQTKTWFDWTFWSESASGGGAGDINYHPALPMAGAAVHKNRLYFLGCGQVGTLTTSFGILFKFFGLNQFTTISNLYADDINAISFDFQPAWKDGGEPSVDKEFKRVKTFNLESGEFVANTTTFDTYRNWSTTTADTTSSFVFSAATDLEKVVTLVLNKCARMLFRWRNSAIHESPLITGYEYIAVSDHENEDFSYQVGGE